LGFSIKKTLRSIFTTNKMEEWEKDEATLHNLGGLFPIDKDPDKI
jgi:hypothetical protein